MNEILMRRGRLGEQQQKKKSFSSLKNSFQDKSREHKKGDLKRTTKKNKFEFEDLFFRLLHPFEQRDVGCEEIFVHKIKKRSKKKQKRGCLLAQQTG